MSRRNTLKTLLVLVACLSWAALSPVSYAELSSSKDSEKVDATQSLKDLEARLNAIDASGNTSEKNKELIKDFYQRAIDNITAATENRAKAEQYIELMNTAPGKLDELQRDIDESRDVQVSVSDTQSIETLEQQQLEQQAKLLELRNKQADLSTKTLSEQQSISNLLEEALQQQATALADSGSQPVAEPVEVANARKALQLSEIEVANSRVEMLRQRLMSRDTRLQVLAREQQLIARQVKISSTRLTAIEDTLNRLRQTKAEEKAKQAEQREAMIDASDESVKEVASEITTLASDISNVTKRIDALLSQLDDMRQDRSRVDRYFNSMSQQLAIAGADRLASLSVDLLAQRQQFAKSLPEALDVNTLDKELTKAQLKQLSLEDKQYTFVDDSDPLTGALANELLEEQQRLLQDGVKSYRRYTAVLMDVLNEEKALRTKIDEYQNLLNSRLFWIPSASPIYVSFFDGLKTEIKSYFDLNQWTKMFKATDLDEDWSFVGIFLFLIAVCILAFHSVLKKLLNRFGENVGKVNKDKFSKTVFALIVTIILALPGPLFLIALIDWIPGGHIGLPQKLRLGLANAALLWLLLGIFRQICRSGGVAEVHFQWSPRILNLAQNHLPWFTMVLVILSFFMQVASDVHDTYQTISRLLFGAVSITLSYAIHQALKPVPVLSDDGEPIQTSRQRRFFRYFVYVLFVVLPLVMLLLSWVGYHFTALEVQNRLFLSACLLAILLVLCSLALRAVAVLERRMKLERLKAKRKAERELHESRLAADDGSEALPEVVEEPEFDMAQVSKQSRGFIGVLTVIVSIYLLAGLWGDVMPALNMFDKMELWSVSTGDPSIPVKSITVIDVVLSIFLLVMTYLGVRNIPGILEISVLRGVNLGPGGSYAITTVVKYIIVVVGVISSLNLMGLPWSKLQWLVAAMGVGLGFGLQEILANFVSGLLILFERPIRVGDTVTVGTNTGTVTKIRIRATTLTDWDRKEQIIPNKVFITEQLTNWTLSDPITRLVVKVGVAYGSDVVKVHELLTQVVTNNSTVVTDPPPSVFFVGFGDSSLDFEVRVFVPGLIELMPLVHELHMSINETFRENDVEIPFPQRDVWIREVPDARINEPLPPIPSGAQAK
ncbi:mechanosensitive ion channel domain-containing protein [Pseudomaricurvus sp.]|uniref:mechanosensitive ion channel domain-containing protein n=1 Tax=Pseudomaricurvus sp. TaxID=2004510 RepID=UPI003F6BFF3E